MSALSPGLTTAVSALPSAALNPALVLVNRPGAHARIPDPPDFDKGRACADIAAIGDGDIRHKRGRVGTGRGIGGHHGRRRAGRDPLAAYRRGSGSGARACESLALHNHRAACRSDLYSRAAALVPVDLGGAVAGRVARAAVGCFVKLDAIRRCEVSGSSLILLTPKAPEVVLHDQGAIRPGIGALLDGPARPTRRGGNPDADVAFQRAGRRRDRIDHQAMRLSACRSDRARPPLRWAPRPARHNLPRAAQPRRLQ